MGGAGGKGGADGMGGGSGGVGGEGGGEEGRHMQLWLVLHPPVLTPKLSKVAAVSVRMPLI